MVLPGGGIGVSLRSGGGAYLPARSLGVLRCRSRLFVSSAYSSAVERRRPVIGMGVLRVEADGGDNVEEGTGEALAGGSTVEVKNTSAFEISSLFDSISRDTPTDDEDGENEKRETGDEELDSQLKRRSCRFPSSPLFIAAMRRVEDDDAVVSLILEDGAVCEVEEVEGGRKARIEFSEERLRVPA